MNAVETEFARKVIDLTKAYQGKLPSGGRAIWLFAAALASLDDDSHERVGLDGFLNAGRVVFYRVRHYLGPRFW